MEEAGSNPSIDLPPPEAPEETTEGIRETVLEQASTPPLPSPSPSATGLPGTPNLPPHPVIQLSQAELQEHRDAILQQQMLGRKLLSELTRRHEQPHHHQ